MSLKDIVSAAASEAKENVSVVHAKDEETQAAEDANGAKVKAGADLNRPLRASAASAKPAVAAGSSVRTAKTSAAAPKSKEQKRADKAKQREREDLRAKGYELVLRQDPEYAKTDRTWWIILGAGFIVCLVSLVLTQTVPAAMDFTTNLGLVAAVLLVLAYVLIIAAFIYDFVRRRPLRRAAERKAAGLTDKKIVAMMAEARKEADERLAAKRAKRSGIFSKK